MTMNSMTCLTLALSLPHAAHLPSTLYTHPPIPRLLVEVRLPTAYTAPNRLRLACAADLRRPHRRWLPRQRALPPQQHPLLERRAWLSGLQRPGRRRSPRQGGPALQHLAAQAHKAKAWHAVGGGAHASFETLNPETHG